jgi:hypothetical protein
MLTTLFLSVPTISAAGRMLATRLSRVSLYTTSLAVLTSTRNCEVRQGLRECAAQALRYPG